MTLWPMARLISEAVAAQVQVVKEWNSPHNAGGSPEFFSYLWSEMTELFVGGHLQFPEEVTVVHADNGNGFVQDADLKLTKAGDGCASLPDSLSLFVCVCNHDGAPASRPPASDSTST